LSSTMMKLLLLASLLHHFSSLTVYLTCVVSVEGFSTTRSLLPRIRTVKTSILSSSSPADEEAYVICDNKEIFGVKGSDWSSPDWKWGSAMGTAHECASVCRALYSTEESRAKLIDDLILDEDEIMMSSTDPERRREQQQQRVPINFEEVKFILALVFQKARKKCYGGLESYGEVLDEIVKAKRYEPRLPEDEDDDVTDDAAFYNEEFGPYLPTMLLVQDIQKRYFWLQPEVQDKIQMNMLLYDSESDYDWVRRKCAGLTLKAIEFEEMGF